MGIRVLGVGVATGLLCFSACGGSSKGKGSTTVAGIDGSDGLSIPRVDATLCDTKGKRVETFDLNHDGVPDVWKMYTTADEGGTSVEILTCKQVDLDRDGKKDYVQTYSRTGEIIAEEFDFTFEGSMDAREHYDKKTGKIYLIERDTDHDNQPDVWEKYDKDGLLESVRRDRNADGKPDLWEQYKSGVLIAILYDDDFDGKVDRKEEVKATAPTSEPADDEGDEEGDLPTDAPVDEDTE